MRLTSQDGAGSRLDVLEAVLGVVVAGDPALPPYDNMGVDNATECGPTAPTVAAEEAILTPEDYFYRLALDTLQVALIGQWMGSRSAERLLAKRHNAEYYRVIGFGKETHEAPGGRLLQVMPHGGRPSYQVLMRDADGLEIRGLPSSQMPPLILRFGARWCNEHSLAALREWILEFAGSLGFYVEKIQLSEVHVRCDVPTPFVQGDLKKMRGAGTRNGRFNSHFEKHKFSGVDNLGGQKKIKFVIYDKRLEQSQKQGYMWPAIWRSYGIDPDTPIWRVEGRFSRKILAAIGLDSLSDLSHVTLAGLWYLFTSNYLLFVSDGDKRTVRAGPSRKWAKIQKTGKLMEPRPLVASVDVTATQLFKQGVGCIAKALAVSGAGLHGAELERALRVAIDRGVDQFAARNEEYAKELAGRMRERVAAMVCDGDQLTTKMLPMLVRAAERRLPIHPFAPVRPGVGVPSWGRPFPLGVGINLPPAYNIFNQTVWPWDAQ